MGDGWERQGIPGTNGNVDRDGLVDVHIIMEGEITIVQ